MSTVIRKVKGILQATHYCDTCGKKISKKGQLTKSAHAITSNSLPHLHGKEFCDHCFKQL